MKILLIEPGGYGATFQYTHNLANALAKRKHKVAMASGIKFETKGYPVFYDVYVAFDRFIPRPLRLTKFIRSVRKMKPDIIHIQGHLHPDMYLLIWLTLRTVTRARFIYTAQDILPKNLRIHHPWVLKMLYEMADHIFVNARQNRKTLLKNFSSVKPDKITVNPIADLTAFIPRRISKRPSNIPEHAKIILFFGIIEPRKGVMPLIRAFAHVHAQVPEAFLLIVGKAFEDVDQYYREIRRLEISDHLLFRNEYIPLDEIPTLFSIVDVFVAPYLAGWNSGAIATAYAHGKPVIASSIGGIIEVIEDGQTGFLIPPGDEKALARAIISILEDDSLLHNMSEAARVKGEMNSWPQIAKRTEKVYQSVLYQS